MNKMREAFEYRYCMPWATAPINIKEDFEAGYRAAIAAVKEGGPDCYRGQEGVTDLAYDAVAPYYPLYCIPEDAP